MELIENLYHYLFWGVLIVLALCVVGTLVYIVAARLTVDRIIGINLVSTIIVIIVALLTYLLGEDYLADIDLIYVVLSFISVMMLCKIYINLYSHKEEWERKRAEQRKRQEEADDHDR
jgi:multicomponent Na+:H+ antiporter subunit F